jgi:hypothetical protein
MTTARAGAARRVSYQRDTLGERVAPRHREIGRLD